MPEKEIGIITPSSVEDWKKWLQENHTTESCVWLIYYKKSSNKPSISWSEAVDVALCFGWIDSVKKPIDAEKYKQFFTPRKPKSNWSKINKEKIEKLIEAGLMTEAGLKSIEIAKENGSWIYLDEVEALVIPADLELELSLNSVANTYFLSLSKSARKILLHWVLSAKTTKTRQKRISEIVENAQEKQKPKAFRY